MNDYVCKSCRIAYLPSQQMTNIKVIDEDDRARVAGPYCEACMKRGFLLKDKAADQKKLHPDIESLT